MQITELLKLAEWFKINIVEEEVITRYTNLFNKMNQNLRVNNNQPSQPYEIEKKSLFEALKTITLNTLTLEQISFLEQLEVTQLFGTNGVQVIESILYEYNLDIASATKKISEFSNKIKSAQNTLQEIETTLTKSFSIDEEYEIPEDSIMMRVYFQDDSSINNLADFKKLGASWYEIGRGIAMAQGRSPEDFSVIGAQKGSLILEMAVLAGLATSVSTILLAGLKVAERTIEILKKVEELKTLKLGNKKIEQELEKEAKKEKEDGVQFILDTTIKEIGLKKGKDGDKIAALNKSITKLIDFTQKGGAVDFIQPDDEIDGEEENHNDVREEVLKLIDNVKEIRSIENKIKMLE